VRVDEAAVPLSEGVRGACELLGLDPLGVACEGRFVAFVAPGDAERALAVLRAHPVARGAAAIGRVEARGAAPVLLDSVIGTTRILDMQSGEQLPRIC
jgi:hydrogenase expression/formation protein HypE